MASAIHGSPPPRLLLLGGTGEAVTLARRLAPRWEVIYSLAGSGGAIPPDCRGRRGGFGGVEGLAGYLTHHAIAALVDATHPFAVTIKAHAAAAARQVQVPLWRYIRPPWCPGAGDDWRFMAHWDEVQRALGGFRRPFIALGRSALTAPPSPPAGAHWWWRCLPPAPPLPPGCRGISPVAARGPFTVAGERQLLGELACDVVVAKNSGGWGAAAKLTAARQLGLPVLLIERPPVAPVADTWTDLDALGTQLLSAPGLGSALARP